MTSNTIDTIITIPITARQIIAKNATTTTTTTTTTNTTTLYAISVLVRLEKSWKAAIQRLPFSILNRTKIEEDIT